MDDRDAPMNILLTGATGFVGSTLLTQLLNQGHHVRAAVRRDVDTLPHSVVQYRIQELSEATDWVEGLHGVDLVIHLAARVHMMQDNASDPLEAFRRVNTAGTLNLARQSADAGVKRFVFLSSIKVNGESTLPGYPFTPDDDYTPDDPYGLSKWEAEQGLFKLTEASDMEVVVIRPPLVYGPGVKANFRKMMHWMQKGVPLPLGSVHNRRSLIALDNLVSFIMHCMEHSKAANEVFLISDGEDVSTTELLQRVARAQGKRARLLPIPVGVMEFVARMMGKEDVATRLFASLQIDSSKAHDLLGWEPVISMDAELQKMVSPS